MVNLLYIDWDFNPTIISLFGFEIRYYSLMWVAAILIGAEYFKIYCRREGLKEEVAESIFLYGTLGTILGARIGHCVFYEPEYYLSQPWTIITEFRNGGLASHGAAMGILVGIWLFARRNKLPFLWALDRFMIPTGLVVPW